MRLIIVSRLILTFTNLEVSTDVSSSATTKVPDMYISQVRVKTIKKKQTKKTISMKSKIKETKLVFLTQQ